MSRIKNGVGRSFFNVLLLILISGVLAACGGGGSGSNAVLSISGTPATSVDQNSAYSFLPNATNADPNNRVLTFAIANQPTWASFDAATGALTGTTANADVGSTAGVEISVSDGVDAPVSLPAFDLTVNNVNDAPTISGTPASTIAQNAAYNFTPTAGDIDGDTLLFSITNKPAWAGFDAATGALTGTPSNSDVDTTMGIVISVDDQQGQPNSTASLPAFDLTVTNVNDPPNISGSPATRVGELAAYSFTPTASDVDPTGDTLVFSITNKPTWASFDTATGALTGTTTSGDVGTTPGIVISVDDQQGASNSVASLPAFDISVVRGFNEALYATPTVSSFNTNAERRRYQANDGINTSLTDPDTDASNGWVGAEDPNNPSAQAWIRIDFDSTKTIYRVTLADLLINYQVQQATIEFSDGSSIPVTTPLPDDGTPVDFVFDPKQTDWIKVTETQVTGGFGLAEIAAYSMLTPNQSRLAQDLFNDGNATGWSVNNTDCQKGTDAWNAAFTFWPGSGSGNQYQQTGQCRGFSIEGVEIGTYALQTTAATAGIDLRLRLRSDDDGTNSGWQSGAVGVLFGYQDNNNYYRLDLSQQEGHRKLIKKEAGVFSELNSSPQSYISGSYSVAGWELTYPDAWVNLRVVQQNGVIVVYVNGTRVLAAKDSTFNGGQIALFCARNQSCAFDNVVLLEGPTDPIAGVNIDDGAPHRSSEYFVSASDSLNVSAVMTSSTGVDSVEFVLDEGLSGEASLTDPSGPSYSALFGLLPAGEHTMNIYLLDGSGQRWSDSEASAALSQLGTGGIHLVALGDSIAGGLLDDITSDNISMDGRNTSGGFQPLLNDYLTADNAGKPVTVLNEANAGETSGEAAARIVAVLDRTPAAKAYLMTYGANDSGGGTPTPSGLGLASGDSGYAGSFKDNMQQMIDAILAAGKEVYLSRTPPHTTDTGRDTRIQGYNNVIDELVTENGFTYTPPDFHAYFTANQAEMADQLHPNGVGYQSMARLWCDSLNQPGMLCGFPY